MIQSNCKNCNRNVIRYGKKPGIFCCKKCHNAWMENKVDIDLIVKLYQDGISLSSIGKIVGLSKESISKRLKKSGIAIRSKTTHMSGENNPFIGKHLSHETKNKISDASRRQFSNPKARAILADRQIKAIKSGKIKKVSKIEHLVAKELDSQGIKYERQYGFRNELGQYCCLTDFFIPGKNIAIEVNGTFWHVDKRKYPQGPICDIQKSCLKAYNKKIKYFKEHNIKLSEIWEIDIMKDIKSAVKNLKLFEF